MKNFALPIVAASLIALSITGCASMSNRTKTILTMVGTGLVVGTYTASRAADGDNPAAIGALWGGTTAAASGVVGMFLFDEQHRSEIFEKQLISSQHEVDIFRGEGYGNSHTPLFDSDTSLERQLPSEYQGLVQPGKWSIYRVNNWVSQGENTLVHQDKMVRIVPPQFKAKSLSEGVSQQTNKGDK